MYSSGNNESLGRRRESARRFLATEIVLGIYTTTKVSQAVANSLQEVQEQHFSLVNQLINQSVFICIR